MLLIVPIIVGVLLGWLIMTALTGSTKPYIANPGRHSIGDTDGMSDAQLIEQWRRCRIPGCRDCAKTAFTRDLLIEAANGEEEDW